MKYIAMKAGIFAISMALPLAASATATYAEDGQQVNKEMRHHHKGKRHFAKMARYLALTDEQKEKIRDIYQQAGDDRQDVVDARHDFHQQVKSLVESSNFSDDAFLSLYNAHSEQFAQAALQRAKVKNAIYQLLTEEQRVKFAQFKEQGKGKRKHKGERFID